MIFLKKTLRLRMTYEDLAHYLAALPLRILWLQIRRKTSLFPNVILAGKLDE